MRIVTSVEASSIATWIVRRAMNFLRFIVDMRGFMKLMKHTNAL